MKAKLHVVLLLLITFSLSAQQKTYRDKKGIATTAENASIYETEESAPDSIHRIIRTYSLDGTLFREITIIGPERILDGRLAAFDPKGNIVSEANYKMAKRHGATRGYWDNGKLRIEQQYSNDTLVSETHYDRDGNELIVKDPVNLQPQFPGGNEAFNNYFKSNFNNKISGKGKMLITFVIEKDGSVTEIKVPRGINDRIDKEAIRVLESMPKWIPGKQNGKAVRSQYSFPISIDQ